MKNLLLVLGFTRFSVEDVVGYLSEHPALCFIIGMMILVVFLRFIYDSNSGYDKFDF